MYDGVYCASYVRVLSTVCIFLFTWLLILFVPAPLAFTSLHLNMYCIVPIFHRAGQFEQRATYIRYSRDQSWGYEAYNGTQPESVISLGCVLVICAS